jgi:hypothetical protein
MVHVPCSSLPDLDKLYSNACAPILLKVLLLLMTVLFPIPFHSHGPDQLNVGSGVPYSLSDSMIDIVDLFLL